MSVEDNREEAGCLGPPQLAMQMAQSWSSEGNLWNTSRLQGSPLWGGVTLPWNPAFSFIWGLSPSVILPDGLQAFLEEAWGWRPAAATPT